MIKKELEDLLKDTKSKLCFKVSEAVILKKVLEELERILANHAEEKKTKINKASKAKKLKEEK